MLRAYNVDDEGALQFVADHQVARPTFLGDLLRKAAGKLGEGERIVLVIDGLDEAGANPGENALGLPRILPRGVFILVSKRPVRVPLAIEGPKRVLSIDAESASNVKDARDYLTRAITWPGVARALRTSRKPGGGRYTAGEFVDAVVGKSQGVWIYIHHVISAIEEDYREAIRIPPQLDLDDLPEGLWADYAGFWRRWKEEHESEWHSVHLPLLATLAALREEVSLGLLCRLAGIDGVFELPARWLPFLTVPRAGEPRYRLYHESLGDFLRGRGEQTEMTEDDLDFAGGLARAARDAHNRIAGRYSPGYARQGAARPVRSGTARFDGGYGHRHVTVHLRKAG